ncbi:hypothetical protein [Streptomyces sp. LN785]
MLGLIAVTGFAACRAQRQRVFKTLAYLCLSIGIVSVLTPVGVLVWASTL